MNRRVRLFDTLLIGLVLVLGADAHSATPADAEAADETRAARSEIPRELAPPTKWLEDRIAGAASGQRIALVVGIGKHARRPDWNLDWVAGDVAHIAKALRENAGFDDVRVLADDEVSKAALESQVEDLGARIGAEGNVIVVYWAGLGRIDEHGELRLVLHDTDEKSVAGREALVETLGESELAGVLTPLRRDGKTRVLVFVNACQGGTAAPPKGRSPKEVDLADAVLYSAGRGFLASPAKDQKLSVFATSLSRACADLWTTQPRATILELANSATAHMKELISPELQMPELIAREASARELRIFDKARLSFGVRVVDGITGGEIPARVRLPGHDATESPARFSGLVQGTYRVELSLSGYVPRIVSIAVKSDVSGRFVEAALLPARVEITGIVGDEDGKVLPGAECRLEGPPGASLRDDADRDDHEIVSMTDAEGRFRFIVPPGARPEAIAVVAGATTKRHPLDLAKLEPRREQIELWERRTYELGAIILLSGTDVDGMDLGLRGRDLATWNSAEKHVRDGKSEDLDLAVSAYVAVLPKIAEGSRKKAEARLRAVYGELISHRSGQGRYEEALSHATKALEHFPADRLLEELRTICAREEIPNPFRDRLRAASKAIDDTDFRAAESIYTEIDARSDELTPYYRKSVRENLAAVRDKLFLDALSTLDTAWIAGDTTLALASFREIARIDPEYPVLETWRAKLAVEKAPETPTASVEPGPATAAGTERRIPGFTFTGKNEQGHAEYRHDKSGIIFVLIPGGEFEMGSPEEEPGREDDEARHTARVDDFLLAKYEVTQREWRRILGTSPSNFTNAGDDAPVENVSWNMIRGEYGANGPDTFCGKTGLQLPTEAQWEYACRAGSTTAIYTGPLRILGVNHGPELDAIAWYGGNSGVTYEGGYDSTEWEGKQYPHERAGTHPVGKKAPNAFGLHDMIGNVWEWCEDAYDWEFYSKPEAAARNPMNPIGSEGRVLRGGCWGDNAGSCRASYRGRGKPSGAGDIIGFRPSFSPLP
jgi:formylglycine-generating enzyme required for sulfatase activity